MRWLVTVLTLALTTLGGGPALLGKWELARHYDGHQQRKAVDGVWIFYKDTLITPPSSTPMSYKTGTVGRKHFTYSEHGAGSRKAAYEIREDQLRILLLGPRVQELPVRIRPTEGMEYLVFSRAAPSPHQQPAPPQPKPRIAAKPLPSLPAQSMNVQGDGVPQEYQESVRRFVHEFPDVFYHSMAGFSPGMAKHFRGYHASLESAKRISGGLEIVIAASEKPQDASNVFRTSFHYFPPGRWQPKQCLRYENGRLAANMFSGLFTLLPHMLAALTKRSQEPATAAKRDPNLIDEWHVIRFYQHDRKVDIATPIGITFSEDSIVTSTDFWDIHTSWGPGGNTPAPHFIEVTKVGTATVEVNVSYRLTGDSLFLLYSSPGAPVLFPVRPTIGGRLFELKRGGARARAPELAAAIGVLKQSGAIMSPDVNGRIAGGWFTGKECGTAELDALAQLPALEVLELNMSKFDPNSFPALQKLPRLRRLNLAMLAISDAHLKLLHGCQKLREVNLSNCPVTQQGVNALKEALANCNVIGQ
jgi:hypothetical protein